MEFDIYVKGVHYQLKAYKEPHNEWDLVVNGKMVCDSKPYKTRMYYFLNMIDDHGED